MLVTKQFPFLLISLLFICPYNENEWEQKLATKIFHNILFYYLRIITFYYFP